MVYTFVQQENPVFCFICREKISPICLGPETKFSREFQHKSYLNPKLVIVTQTNSTKFYFIYFRKKGFIFGCLLWNSDILLAGINFLVLSIQFKLYCQYYISVKKKNSILPVDICQTVTFMQK